MKRPRASDRALAVLWTLVGASSVVACRPRTQPNAALEDAAVDPSVALPAKPVVQLTWRLFETMHSLDSRGQDQESAVFELLVNGGTPARVALGRRASLGCTVRDATDEAGGTEEPGIVTNLDCYAYGHGEYAQVRRSGPGTLAVEAFGQDEATPTFEPPRTGVKTVTVNIRENAAIIVEHEVARIPDEVRAR